MEASSKSSVVYLPNAIKGVERFPNIVRAGWSMYYYYCVL